jgi:hypothetical protein
VTGTLTGTARYIGRCRTCAYRAVIDAEMFSVTVQGKTSAWFGIRILDGDHDDHSRARQASYDALNEAAGRTPVPAHVAMPRMAPWDGFRLDMDGVARRALIRVGLWCPDCNVRILVKPLKAARNEAKRCSDVCKRATSITCDCACGGQMHGRAWMAVSVRIGA